MSASAEPITSASRPRVSPARVFLALLRRDLRVARRELPFFLVRTTLQPLLFIIVFGYLLPRMHFMQSDYSTALLPGVLAVSLAFASIQAVTLPMVQDFGWTREIEDRLLAPVPVSLIALEKVVLGTLQGLISASVVLPLGRLIMGPIAGLTFANVWLLVVLAVLGGAAFSTMGLLMGSLVNPQQIGMMFSVIVAPMLFFGCAYYPWRGLDVLPVMQKIVLVNPLTYVAEGMRGVLTPRVPHMELPIVISALIAISALFWWLGLRAFERRAIG